MTYDDRNTGVLFKNDKKSDKQPDYRGSYTDSNGTKLELAAWLRESQKGVKFLSLKTSPFRENDGGGNSRGGGNSGGSRGGNGSGGRQNTKQYDNDDIPF